VLFRLLVLILTILASANLAYAASTDDGFYKGKTVRLIVAFSAGGGYDTYSRTIARHLGKYITGNPTVVVDNMTGAGGIIHANYMFKQAKPDGLTIGNNSGGLFLQQVMGAKGIEFDGKKFEYLSAPAVDHLTCAISRASGITTLDKWMASKEPVRFGGVGPGRICVRFAACASGRLRVGGASDRRLQGHVGYPFGDRKRRARRQLSLLGFLQDDLAQGDRIRRSQYHHSSDAEKTSRVGQCPARHKVRQN
jgi:hypothetical protein